MVEPTVTRDPEVVQPVVEAVLDATAESERAPSNDFERTEEPVTVAAISPTGAAPLPEESDSIGDTVVHLITLAPRVALATVRGITHVVGRGIASVTGSDRPSS